VVSYIVCSGDEILRADIGLEDGLADITTWREMALLHKDLTIPEGTPATQAFVQILDPATGTGTFLVEVIDLIHGTLIAKWRAAGKDEDQIETLWNEYVPEHLLPRIHGYELMMAPYAIAHLKVGLKLYETGYRFESDERARVFLTNSLEPARDFSEQLEFTIPAFAHEADAVRQVKRRMRFTVVIGNPPYSKLSSNLAPEHRQLVDAYRHVNGERVAERGALALEMNLQDDYVKFVRLAQMALDVAGTGVAGLITNHGYLSTPTLRGMRWSLLRSFKTLRVLDLHGHSGKGEVTPDGTKDENVFDIQQGVAVSLCTRPPDPTSPEVAREVLTYVYAILHSPTYRVRYFSFLRSEFPRIPMPASRDLLDELFPLGRELVGLHLMETGLGDQGTVSYVGPEYPEVRRVGWSDGTVWLDGEKTRKREGRSTIVPGSIGFHGVPEAVWNFHVGGYQFCEKWLKDRKGRTLLRTTSPITRISSPLSRKRHESWARSTR